MRVRKELDWDDEERVFMSIQSISLVNFCLEAKCRIKQTQSVFFFCLKVIMNIYDDLIFLCIH